MSTDVHRTEPWQFRRVVAVIEHCAAREFVREVFDHHRGAHRKFTADAFLAAYLLTPMLGLPMHQTKVATVVRGWTDRRRAALEPPDGVPISYKAINDALRRLMKACRSPRYPEWGERRFVRALLDASLWCFPPTGAGALDSTDISTWARVRYRKPVVDADPDGLPPPDHPLAPPDPNHPHARRRGHHLPDAPVGADGRYIYTVDITARMGRRSPEFEETMFFCGFDLHVVTDVPSAPGRGPVVHVARAMNLAPAGSNKGISGLPAVQALGDAIGKPRHLITDRAYNYVTDDKFALPVWRLGYTTIYDLHSRGTHPGPEGSHAIWIDGTLYAASLPAGLEEIDPIDVDMKGRGPCPNRRTPPGTAGLRLRSARGPAPRRIPPLPWACRPSCPGSLPEQSRLDARTAERADDLLHNGHGMRTRAHHYVERLGLPGPTDAFPARHPGLGGVLSP
ncbi:hypothetical protein [Rhodococcus opacus]|uniref:hypothetical protein n=1 Tax=Rhodococcus opacus TaxID=37919 RepID=UPI002954CAB8|nr:hypothetical protein [Rhodococcus opacus]